VSIRFLFHRDSNNSVREIRDDDIRASNLDSCISFSRMRRTAPHRFGSVHCDVI
jgi:hypothetical protein